MDAHDDAVLAAARSIRPYLGDLVGAEAGPLDERIAALLDDSAEPPAAVTELRVLLNADDDTKWFLEQVVADAPYHRPPYQQPDYLGYRGNGVASPAGDPGPILAPDAYACPHGDYVWYRPELGSPIPACPTHDVRLTRV